jgi:hypothetical protein
VADELDERVARADRFHAGCCPQPARVADVDVERRLPARRGERFEAALEHLGAIACRDDYRDPLLIPRRRHLAVRRERWLVDHAAATASGSDRGQEGDFAPASMAGPARTP